MGIIERTDRLSRDQKFVWASIAYMKVRRIDIAIFDAREWLGKFHLLSPEKRAGFSTRPVLRLGLNF